jgi:elongation factor 1-gamma
MNGLEIALPEFNYPADNKKPEWLAKFPLGKVPALETVNDPPVCIAESGAVAHFVADSGPASAQLLGATPDARARIQQWILHNEHEVFPAALTGIMHKRAMKPFVQKNEDDARKSLDRIAAVIEDQLEHHKWLARTDRFSLADLATAATLSFALKEWLPRDWRDAHPNIVAWYLRVQKEFPDIFGEPAFLE